MVGFTMQYLAHAEGMNSSIIGAILEDESNERQLLTSTKCIMHYRVVLLVYSMYKLSLHCIERPMANMRESWEFN